MESKHTPGPWKAAMTDCKIRGSRMQWSMGTNTGEFVADVGGCDKLTAQANARLIAAAPEMLEALRTIHQWSLDMNGKIPEADPAVWSIRDVVKQAIAKAEGK